MLRTLGSQLLRRSNAAPGARVFTSSTPRLADGGDDGPASTQKRIEVRLRYAYIFIQGSDVRAPLRTSHFGGGRRVYARSATQFLLTLLRDYTRSQEDT